MAGTSQRGLTFLLADRFGGGVYTALDLTRDFGTVVSWSVALPSVTPGHHLETRRAGVGSRSSRGRRGRGRCRRWGRDGRRRRGCRRGGRWRRGRRRSHVDGHRRALRQGPAGRVLVEHVARGGAGRAGRGDDVDLEPLV